MKRRNFLFLVFLGNILSSCSITQLYDATVDWKFKRNDIVKKVMYDAGDTITYYSGGSGDTLILIHGFGSGGQQTWQSNIKTLSKKHYLIVPDLFAFGESTSANQQYNLVRQVALLNKICKKEKVTRTSVAGISYGGFVALLYANQKDVSVHKLVIIDSPGHIYESQNAIRLAEKYGEQSPADIFMPKNYKEVQRLINLGLYKDKKIPKFVLEKMYQAYFTDNQMEQEKAMRALLNSSQPKIKEQLKDGRTAVIWGREDEIFELKYGEALANTMNAEIFIIDDAGHIPNAEKSKTFSTILLSLLK